MGVYGPQRLRRDQRLGLVVKLRNRDTGAVVHVDDGLAASLGSAWERVKDPAPKAEPTKKPKK